MFRREWAENIILDTALSALPFEPNNLQVKFLICHFCAGISIGGCD
jgi:hypothetical protein